MRTTNQHLFLKALLVCQITKDNTNGYGKVLTLGHTIGYTRVSLVSLTDNQTTLHSSSATAARRTPGLHTCNTQDSSQASLADLSHIAQEKCVAKIL